MPAAQAASSAAAACSSLTGAYRPAIGAPPKTIREIISSFVPNRRWCTSRRLPRRQPRGAGRERELSQRLGPYPGGRPGGLGRAVPAAGYDGGGGEMLVQVIDPLDHPPLRGPGERHVV